MSERKVSNLKQVASVSLKHIVGMDLLAIEHTNKQANNQANKQQLDI